MTTTGPSNTAEVRVGSQPGQLTQEAMDLQELQQIIKQLTEEIKAARTQQGEQKKQEGTTGSQKEHRNKEEEAKEARLEALREVEDVRSVLAVEGTELRDFGWVTGRIGELQQVQDRLESFAHDTNVSQPQRESITKELQEVKRIEGQLAAKGKELRWQLLNDTSSNISTTEKLVLMYLGKSSEQVKRSDQRDFAKKMWLMVQYVEDRNILGTLEVDEQARIRQIRTDAERMLTTNGQQEDGIGKHMLERLRARYGEEGHTWDASHERLVIGYLADPDGTKLNQEFKGSITKYNKWLTTFIMDVRENVTLLYETLQKIARGEIADLPENDLEIALQQQDKKKQIEILEKKARSEARKRLHTTERQARTADMDHMRNLLTTMYGDEADPALFIELVEAQLEELGEHAPMKAKLELATRLVAQFNPPRMGKPEKNYALGDLFDNAELEIVCTVRNMILRQVIEESINDENYVVLAAYKNPLFSSDGRINPEDKGHVRLYVMNKTDSQEGYYVDPSQNFLSQDATYRNDLIEEASYITKKRIFDAYGRTRDAEALVLQGEKGHKQLVIGEELIGNATKLLTMANFNNLAVLTGDKALAQEAIDTAGDNLVSHLVLYQMAQGATEKNKQFEAILEHSPAAKDLLKNKFNNDKNAFKNMLDGLKQETFLTEVMVEPRLIEANAARQMMYDLQSNPAATQQDYEKALRQMYETLDLHFKNRRYSNNFEFGVGALTAELETWATNVDDAFGTKWFDYYRSLELRGNIDVAYSLGNYQEAAAQAETFSWKLIYGPYETVPGLNLASNSTDNEMEIIIANRGDISEQFGKLEVGAADDLTRYKEFLVDDEDINALTADAIKLAANHASKIYYTSNSWSRHLGVDSAPKPGPQYFSPTKGGQVAELFNPFAFSMENLNPVANILVRQGLGMAEARRMTAGLHDMENMLTHRHVLLGGIRYNFLTEQGLYRQLKEAVHSKEAYDAQIEEFRKARTILNRENLAGEGLGGVGPDQHQDFIVLENMRKYFIEKGYQDADLKQGDYFKELIDNEIYFLDNKCKGYDRELGETRYYWADEIVAMSLMFNAYSLFNGYMSNSEDQRNLFRDAGAYAHQLGINTNNNEVEQGKQVNQWVSKLMQFGYNRNQEKYEVVSGRIARKATDAVKSIRQLLAEGAVDTDFEQIRQIQLRERELRDYTRREREDLEEAKRSLRDAENSSAYKAAKARRDAMQKVINEWGETSTGKPFVQELFDAERELDNYYAQVRQGRVNANPAVELQLKANIDAKQLALDGTRPGAALKAARDEMKRIVSGPNTQIVAAEQALSSKLGSQRQVDLTEALRQARAAAKGNPVYDAYLNLMSAQDDMQAHRDRMQRYIDKNCRANPGMREHFSRQIAKADRAITALGNAVNNPMNQQVLEAAARASRNAVVDRLKWNQILTAENLYEYENSKSADHASAEELGAAQRKIQVLQRLYENQAVFIAGKNNWQRINSGSLRDFKFQEEKNSIWAQVLDPNAKINGAVNKAHGPRAYVQWNHDDVRIVAQDDKKLVAWVANKPQKSNIGDIQAAAEYKKTFMNVLQNPYDEKAWHEHVGKFAAFNSRDEEYEQNAHLLDAALKAGEQALFIRMFLPDPIGRGLETLFPELKPLLARLSGQFYEDINVKFAGDFTNSLVRIGAINEYWANWIKKKHKVRIKDQLPIFGTSWLMWLFMYLVTNPDKITGMELKL